MVRTVALAALAVLVLGAVPAARAQVHDGADNTSSEQRIADQLRAAGSKCGAPACHDEPGAASVPDANVKAPATPAAGQPQPRD